MKFETNVHLVEVNKDVGGGQGIDFFEFTATTGGGENKWRASCTGSYYWSEEEGETFMIEFFPARTNSCENDMKDSFFLREESVWQREKEPQELEKEIRFVFREKFDMEVTSIRFEKRFE